MCPERHIHKTYQNCNLLFQNDLQDVKKGNIRWNTTGIFVESKVCRVCVCMCVVRLSFLVCRNSSYLKSFIRCVFANTCFHSEACLFIITTGIFQLIKILNYNEVELINIFPLWFVIFAFCQGILPLWSWRSSRLSSQWGVGVILGEEMATHSSILAWKIPWTEEHGRLQSMGS